MSSEDGALPVLGVLPSSWRIASFGSVLLGGTRNGIYKPKQHHGSGAKIVNMGELFAHRRLHPVGMKRLRVTPSELERFGLQQGDLIFARRSLVAAGAGRCSLVCAVDEPTVFESSIIRARPNPVIADSAFLFYLFSSPYGEHALRTITRTVAVSGITGRDLAELPIPLPPLAEQHQIAEILSALDDKIEVTRRMNHTLESIARAIFRSWFVHFDPVRKKMVGGDQGLPPNLDALFPDTVCDSALGDMPSGWTVGCLGDVAVQVRDSVRPGDIRAGTAYFGLEHLPKRSIALGDWTTADGVASGKTRFGVGDILFGKLRPYFHKVGPPPVAGVCSTDIVVVRPLAAEFFALVLGYLSSDEFVDYTNAAASGTRMPRTSWRDMAAYPVAVPPRAVCSAYEAVAGPIVNLIQGNITQSRTLSDLRDTALPVLLAGDLALSTPEGGDAYGR